MLLAHAGAVVVWKGGAPCLETHRITAGKPLVLGRNLFGETGDDRISRQHARVQLVGDQLIVTDLQSRNGTTVEGHRLEGSCQPELPAIVRMGRTIAVLVPDIRVFEGLQLAKRGSLVVGASLEGVLAKIDAAARAENHVALIGSLGIGRELAIAYAKVLGGNCAVFDGRGPKLAEVIEGVDKLRTIVIVFNRLLHADEVVTFATYCETDVRFAFVCESYAAVESLPAPLRQQLVHDTISFPVFRFDALPTMVRDMVAAHAPGASAHARVIEEVLRRARRVSEADLMMRLRDSVIAWQLRRTPDKVVFDVRELDLEEPNNNAYCLIGNIVPRRGARPPWRVVEPTPES